MCFFPIATMVAREYGAHACTCQARAPQGNGESMSAPMAQEEPRFDFALRPATAHVSANCDLGAVQIECHDGAAAIIIIGGLFIWVTGMLLVVISLY